MRLLSPLFRTVALGAFCATSLVAQEEVKQPQPADIGVINDVDVTVTDLTEEKLNNPPKREIKIEKLRESLKRQLAAPDPKLFEQKYAATFRVATPPDGAQYRGNIATDEGISQLQYLSEDSLVYPQRTWTATHLGDSFQRMIKFLPPGTTVAKEETAFLADPQAMASISAYLDKKRGIPGGWNILVLGTTPEEAEKRATALLTLLDYGDCRPVQLAIFKRREAMCEQVRAQRKALESSQRAINATQGELRSYVDFTPDMLSNLRVQQLQLEIDLAGVKARIAACEKLLARGADGMLKGDRRSQVEDLKVAAEIEFSGFEARRTKSEEFIIKVKAKIDLLSKQSIAEKSRQKSLSAIAESEHFIQYYEKATRAYAPFPLVDNKITIQPLEWTP